MALNEKRTLQITASLQDFVTKNLSSMRAGIAKFAVAAKNAFVSIWQRINPVAIGIAGLASAWAAFKGGQTVVEVLDSVDALDKLGDSLGTNVDRMAVLKGAIEISGASAEDFEVAMRSLGKAVNGVVDKDSSKMVEAFQRIGISVEDLRRLDVVDLFDRIAGGLERYTSSQERAGALARIMPQQFQALFSALGNGQEQFRGLIALSQMFVGTISEDGAKAAGRFADSIQLIGTAAKSIGRDAFVRIAEKFAPTLEKVAAFLAENREAIATGIAAVVTGFVKLFALLGVAVLKLLALVTGGIDELLEKLGRIPLIGWAIQQAFEHLFNVEPISDGARKIREEAKGVAKELLGIESKISQIRMLPEEMDPAGTKLQAFEEKVKSLKGKLADLSAQFQEAAPGQPDLADTALQTSALDQLSDLLTRLSNFNDLPGLPSDLSAIMRGIFGRGGPDEAATSIEQFFDGVTDQLQKVRDRWRDFGAAGRQAVDQLADGGLDGLADTFSDIVMRTKSAKDAFRDYARSMLSDLSRIISRLLLMNVVSTIFRSAPGTTTATTTGTATTATLGTASLGASQAIGLASPVNTKRVQFGSAGGMAMRSSAAVLSEAPTSRSGDVHVHFAINAVDAPSVQRLLVEQGKTIAAVVAEQAGGANVRFRQQMARATR